MCCMVKKLKRKIIQLPGKEEKTQKRTFLWFLSTIKIYIIFGYTAEIVE